MRCCNVQARTGTPCGVPRPRSRPRSPGFLGEHLDWIDKQVVGRTRGDADDLVREVVLGAIRRLCDGRRAVPNKLKYSLRGFAVADAVRYEMGEILLRNDVIGELGVWERFTNQYSMNECVSKEIGSILRQAKLSNPNRSASQRLWGCWIVIGLCRLMLMCWAGYGLRRVKHKIGSRMICELV